MAIRLAGDRIGYFHIGESNRGYLGAGSINFDRIFDALVDIGYDRDIVFESFSSTIVDQSLSSPAASGATPGPTMFRLPSTPGSLSNSGTRRQSAVERQPSSLERERSEAWRALSGGATRENGILDEIALLASSPSRIRRNNIAAALQALFRHGQLSRADLAREMRLNRSSSGNIIAELLARGLVRQTEPDNREGFGSRPSRQAWHSSRTKSRSCLFPRR